jgi:hypothetical protein
MSFELRVVVVVGFVLCVVGCAICVVEYFLLFGFAYRLCVIGGAERLGFCWSARERERNECE